MNASPTARRPAELRIVRFIHLRPDAASFVFHMASRQRQGIVRGPSQTGRDLEHPGTEHTGHGRFCPDFVVGVARCVRTIPNRAERG